MEAGKYVDPADRYEAAAEYCAKQGYSDPMLAIALVRLSPSVQEEILCNPHDWTRRVHDYMLWMREKS